MAAGFEVGDQGVRATGRGGAFVARSDDGSAIMHNPAGLAKQRGTQLYYSHRLVYQDIEYRRARTLDWSDATHGMPVMADFDHVENDTPLFPLGLMLAVTTDFGLEDFGFAAGIFAPSAAGSAAYDQEGPQKYMMTEMDVKLLYYTISAAWKYQDLFGIGASLQWAHMPSLVYEMVVDGNVSARLVNPVESRFDFLARIEGSDLFKLTSTVGIWLRPFDNWEFAIAGQIIPIHYDIDGHLSLTPQSLDLEEPVSITRDGVADDRVTLSLTFPQKWKAGVRYYKMQGDTELFDIELDIVYEEWSAQREFGLKAGLTVEVLNQTMSVDDISVPKRWQDTVAVRLGGDWNVIPRILWLRGGLFYESPAIRPEYAYVDFFSYHRFGGALGFSYKIGRFDLSMSYTMVLQNVMVVGEDQGQIYQQTPGSPCEEPYTDTELCNERYLGQPGAVANAGTYRAYFHLLNLGVRYVF
jgi:long-subunit fatty acid transport protein